MSQRIALLLSTPAFEEFFGEQFGLNPETYAETYRNDFLWYYAEMFRRHGMEPLIYVPSEGSREKLQTKDGVSVRLLQLWRWHKVAKKLPIWRTPVGRFLGQIMNTLSFAASLKWALERDSVDILYVQEYWSGRFDLLVFLLAKRVCIVGADHGGIRDKNITIFKRFAFSRAVALTSQTQLEAEAVKRFGTASSCLPNPIDTDFFAPRATARARSAAKTILTVARLENTQKRISDLISAMPHLDDTWSLIIAGEGSDRHMLESLVRALDVGERVTFVGFVGGREALRELYWASDVFCLPSAFEGLPMVVLEAMSCSRPVVVTDIPAYRDLIESNVDGFKVALGEPAALASAIQRAFDGSARIGSAARDRIMRGHSQISFMKKFDAEVTSRCEAQAAHKQATSNGRPRGVTLTG